jgi:WD40 repeat protein
MDEVEHQRQLYNSYLRRLQLIEVKVARAGTNASPEDILEQEDIRKELSVIREQLEKLGLYAHQLVHTLAFTRIISTPPPPRAGLILRTKQLDQLYVAANDLCHDKTRSARILRVYGQGGMGKTELVKQLCRDQRVQEIFTTILFCQLGQQPDENVIRADIREIKSFLRSPTTLLILDNVWYERSIAPFLEAQEQSVILMTTRNKHLYKASVHFDIGPMDEQESLQLLEPQYDQLSLDEQQHVINLLGVIRHQWPLLLNLISAFLQRNIQERHISRRIAVEQIIEEYRQKGPQGFKQLSDNEDELDVQQCISIALSDLSRVEQDNFRTLGIFPPDYAIPLKLIHCLWELLLSTEAVESMLDQFDKFCLLERVEQAVRLHDEIADVIAHDPEFALRESTLHGDLLDAVSELYPIENITAASMNDPVARYLMQYLSYHMSKAGRSDTLLDLVCNLPYLAEKIIAFGRIDEILTDIDRAAPFPLAHMIGDAIRQSRALLETEKDPHTLALTIFSRLPLETLPSRDRLMLRTRLTQSVLRPLIEPESVLPEYPYPRRTMWHTIQPVGDDTPPDQEAWVDTRIKSVRLAGLPACPFLLIQSETDPDGQRFGTLMIVGDVSTPIQQAVASALDLIDTVVCDLAVLEGEPCWAVSDDGHYSLFVSGATVMLLDNTTRQVVARSSKLHNDDITHVRFLDRGSYVLTAANDGRICISETLSLKQHRTLKLPSGWISYDYKKALFGDIAVSVDGQQVLGITARGVCAWNIEQPDPSWYWEEKAVAAAFTFDQQYILITQPDGITVKNGDVIQRYRRLKQETSPLSRSLPTVKQNVYIVHFADGSIEQWDCCDAPQSNIDGTLVPNTMQIRPSINPTNSAIADAVGAALSPDGTLLAYVTQQRVIKIWDVNGSWEFITVDRLADINGSLIDIQFDSVGTQLVCISSNDVVVWDIASLARYLALPTSSSVERIQSDRGKTTEARNITILHGAATVRAHDGAEISSTWSFENAADGAVGQRRAAAITTLGEVAVWQEDTVRWEILPGVDRTTCVAIAHDDTLVALTEQGEAVVLPAHASLDGPVYRQKLDPKPSTAVGCALIGKSADLRLAIATAEGEIFLFQVPQFTCIDKIKEENFRYARFAVRGATGITVAWNREIRELGQQPILKLWTMTAEQVSFRCRLDGNFHHVNGVDVWPAQHSVLAGIATSKAIGLWTKRGEKSESAWLRTQSELTDCAWLSDSLLCAVGPAGIYRFRITHSSQHSSRMDT